MTAIRRIVAVAWIEAAHLARDRPSLSLMLVVPAVQLLLFGYAIDLSPKGAPLAIAGPGSARAAAALAHEPEVAVTATGLPSGEAEKRVREGRVALGVELPSPLPTGAAAPPPPVRIVIDGADPADSANALAALQAQTLKVRGGPPVEVVRLYNPDRRSAWILAPGLVGVVVMISMLMLGAQALVREREAGTWETLLATPVRAGEALAGKLAPYLLVSVLQAAAVLALAKVAFDLPFRGAWPGLAVMSVPFAAAHLLLGFAFSAIARTRLQAIQGAIFVYLPSILLSGFMFPFRGMPAWARAIGEALPLTHWVRASRDVLLRGAGVDVVWRETCPVLAFAALAGVGALLAYRRRVV